MSFYQVDSRQLRAKKDELLSLVQRFRQEKENLCAKETALKSMWEGEANDKFHGEFIRSSGQMDSFADTIIRYLNAIETIAQRYDLAEEKNLGRVM
ncbi:MAG: WXG100 family type VII secretion target [Lachnospiraceae bacterium]|nr:WXG100 family type VII secretion target [Lachnospiraceae bacterium]